jgi:transposase
MQKQNNSFNFEGQNIYVGFDAHLKSWQVTILTENLSHKTFVMPARPEVLSNYLREHFPNGTYYSAYEAGFSGFWAHYQLKALGVNNIVVNPADIPTTQKEKVQKEDRRDSRKIARSLRSGDLIPIYVPSESTLDDRSLVRARSMLVGDMTRFKQRIKSFLYFYGITFPPEFENRSTHWSARFMKWLESISMKEQSGRQALDTLIEAARNQRKLLLDITKMIKELSKGSKYSDQVKLLRSIPGIGLINSMVILTEVENIKRFAKDEKFASYVGLIPTSHSSGDKEKIGEITFRSHDFLRKAFIESAWIAVRFDPALLLAYQKLCKRMEPNDAIVRIAKKLLNRVYFVLKNNKEYECNRTI